LKLLIYFCLATAVVSAAVEITRLSTDFNLGPRIFASLIMSVMMIYGIGIMGIRQPAILGIGEWIVNGKNEQQATTEPPQDEKGAVDKAPEKYLKSGLNSEESKILWDKLQVFMQEQKPYLENGLKLNDLADLMDLLPNHLSQIINTHAEKSFFDFINGYRVEAAKKLLKDTERKHLSVAHIAMEAGFNSQNTFYNQFKKHTGTTPSKFKKTMLAVTNIKDN